MSEKATEKWTVVEKWEKNLVEEMGEKVDEKRGRKMGKKAVEKAVQKTQGKYGVKVIEKWPKKKKNVWRR